MKINRYLLAFMLFTWAGIASLKAQCPQNFLQLQPQMNGQQLLLVAYNQGGAMPIDLVVDFGDNSGPVTNMMTSAFTWQHSYPAPGTYNLCVIGTDNNGCVDSVCVPVFAQPCSQNQFYVFAEDSVVNNSVYIYHYVTGGTPPYSFTTTSENQTSTASPTAFDYPNDGAHSYCTSVTDANGCIASYCDTVFTGCINQVPTTFSATPIQTNNVVNFVGTAQGNIASYEWNFGDGNTATGPTQNHLFNQSGFYTVCLTVTTFEGCTGQYCQVVYAGWNCQQNPIVTNLTYQTSGDTVMVYPQTTGGCGSNTYQWTSTGGQYMGGNNPAMFFFPNNGTFQIYAVTADGCGCSNTASVFVTLGCNQQAASTIIMGATSVATTCNANFYDSGGLTGNYLNNQTQTLTVYPATAGGQLSVTFNSYSLEDNYDYLTIYSGTNINSPILATLNGNATAPVTYTSAAANGALTFKWTSDLTVIEAGWNATISCNAIDIVSNNVGGTAQAFSVQSTLNDIETYAWTFGGAGSSTLANPINTFPDGGSYQVCVTVTTTEGCTFSTCEWINIPCNFQVQMETTVNANIMQVVIPNMNPNYYYSLFIPNGNQSWMQVTNDTINYTFTNPGVFDVCLYADGNCFDSTCTTVTISGEGVDTLSGTLWNDTDGDGYFDDTELPISNGYVNVCAGTDSLNCQWAITDANGNYTVYVFDGVYTITGYVNQSFAVQTFPIGAQGYTYTASGGVNQGNFNFGFQNQAVTISGNAYNDLNGNGMRDPNEPGMPNKLIYVGNTWTYTNANGDYSLQLVPGTYLITISTLPSGYVLTEPTMNPPGYNVIAATGNTYTGYDFGYYADPDLQDMRASIYNISTVTPGFPVMNSLSYCNQGAVSQSGTFTLYWDPLLAISSSNVFNPQPSAFDAANNTASWNFSNLAAGGCSYINWNSTAPVSLALGTSITNLVMVTPLDDYNPINNIDTTHQTVVGSWDPNDKRGTPYGEGEEGSILPNTRITYTVRFQNTGTAPAVNVVLVDTISTDFILETLTMNGSSDLYQMTVNPQTRVIRWVFNGIMLPDSTSDPIGSIGFVNFSISPQLNQPSGTRLENFCDIYFDFNEPIRTNTSLHTIDLPTGIESDIETLVNVYPNPFNGTTQFVIHTANQQDADVTIHNVLGASIAKFNAEHGKPTMFDASGLSSGVYFYTVTSAGKQTTGKLIVR
jgi:uncharacterized repeat protein (TIGR01451 family)